MAMTERLRVPNDESARDEPVELLALNNVVVTLAHLVTARLALPQLAHELRWDSTARHGLLASDTDLTKEQIAAVDARLIALSKWQDLNDPDRTLDDAHTIDAAALATLISTDHGIGFDDVRFGELVAFVAELPW